ncbi:MAG: CoB--CoM heterodisulfide reductase iron-sulfur subunit B family protein [Thermoplasmata archaeon]|nr:CoB--CoM heterodisulfide reductase iron-sulfur subunit B family protein [Thermoplasmata archaeon]
MQKFPYYPGCTLKQTAKNFEKSAIASARAIGIELVELPRWNCCGAVSSLTSDEIMRHVAPIRNLVRVQQMNDEGMLENEYRLITLCSMCFNVLKRSNMVVTGDAEMLHTINQFMDTEPDYEGTVEVMHFLEILRDVVGFDKLRARVKKPLKDLKISPYYGCTLLRPKEVGIDDAEAPTIMENFIEALGGEAVDNPYRSLCCGSYHTVGENKKIVAERTYKIINAARRNGADVIITSCPLCAFNLDNRQKLTKEMHPDFEYMPVLYFTQLMAIALGKEEDAGLEDNFVDPRPILRERGFLGVKQ